MNIEQEVLEILKQAGALITDSHLVYTSGKHGSVYVNKDAIYPHTEKASRLGELFAERNKDLDVDVVVGPALGGIILSQWTAFHLSKIKGKEIFGVYTEKTAEGGMNLTRGYDKFVVGKNVLVVEDITNTGGSAKKVVDAVKAAGGNVAAVTVFANRNPEVVNQAYFGAEFRPLAVVPAQAFEEKDCPLCKQNVPINTEVGHGKKYLEAKGLSQ